MSALFFALTFFEKVGISERENQDFEPFKYANRMKH
jgi:hypothetical protein